MLLQPNRSLFRISYSFKTSNKKLEFVKLPFCSLCFLSSYQDYTNKEIDAVIELKDGRWCAFEIKLGANQIDTAAENLIEIRNKIIEEGGKAPSVMCVICGLSNAAYIRPDGVFVVPITSLKN